MHPRDTEYPTGTSSAIISPLMHHHIVVRPLIIHSYPYGPTNYVHFNHSTPQIVILALICPKPAFRALYFEGGNGASFYRKAHGWRDHSNGRFLFFSRLLRSYVLPLFPVGCSRTISMSFFVRQALCLNDEHAKNSCPHLRIPTLPRLKMTI